MSQKVSRHSIDLATAAEMAEFFTEDVEFYLGVLHRAPDSFGNLFNSALNLVRYQCVSDTDATTPETHRSFALAADIGTAMFSTLRPDSDTVSCWIGGQHIHLPPVESAHYIQPINWLNALYLNIIARNTESLQILAEIPASTLRSAESEFEPYIYEWCESLRMLTSGEAGVQERLGNAISATAPESMSARHADYALKIMIPQMRLFHHLTGPSPEQEFNSALFTALELHKEFWSSTPDQASEAEGYIATGPLALACIARDIGVVIDVESEYLPILALEGMGI